MRVGLVLNPEAGGGGSDSMSERLRELGVEVREFDYRDRTAAIAWNPDRLVLAGGDGSIGEVAALAARAEIPLALLPTGTANDFARRIGLPLSLHEACRVAIRGERVRSVDLAWMDGRPFVNVASAGLPPAAARRAAPLKSSLGPLAYAVGALRAGLVAKPLRCAVMREDEQVFSGAAWQLTVACSGAFGAGAQVEADPTDGLLDAVVVEASSRATLVRRAYGLRRGSLGSQPGVVTARGDDFEVSVFPGTTFNVDGEVVRAGPRRFRIDRRALEVVTG